MAGEPLPSEDGAPATLIEAVARRLQRWSGGTMWTCDDSGGLQAEAYEALWRRSLGLSAGLAAREVGAGRIVALALASALEFVPAFWGCLRADCVILPVSGRARQARGEALAQILAAIPEPVVLAEAGSRAGETARRMGLTTFTLDDLEGMTIPGAPPAPATLRPPGRAACLLATSGSTGRVKLAALDEPTLIRRRILRVPLTADPEDAQLMVFDLDSVTGVDAVCLPGPRHGLIPPAIVAGRPLVIAEAIQTQRVTRLNLTCSLAGLIADALEGSDRQWDLSSLKRVTMGAETVDRHVVARLARALGRHGAGELELLGAYGTTESGALARAAVISPAPTPEEAAGPLSLGGPPVGVTLRIVNDAGAVMHGGEVGQIEAQAPGLMFSGYWGEDGATAAAYSPGGWFRTGDLGALVDGRLDLHGRAKDVIIARGAKHVLSDIDAALQGALRDALPSRAEGARLLACHIRRSGDATERLGAVVFSAEGLGAGERKMLEPALRRAAAGRFGLALEALAYAPIGRLPLGPGGKLMRRELSALLPVASFRAGAAQAASSAGDDDWLEALWAQVLACPRPIAPDCDFLELGGDSLAAAQLFAALETRLARRIKPDSFFESPTLANLSRLVESWTGAGPAEEETRSADLYDKLRVRMAPWPGSRPTRDRLLAGLNLSGSKPPLYWVFQGGEEFAALAEALGPGQPLCGFRSGHLVFRYSEDNVEEIAHRYVDDLLEAHPEGPFSLGGNCQGGILALAMAGRLAELGRAPELLVLMEWTFRLRPYAGPVLFLHGVATQAPPGPTAAQLPGGFEARPIPGAHGGFFWRGNVEGLAAILSEHLAASA